MSAEIKPPVFVGLDRSKPAPKGELLELWESGIKADIERARAEVDEWLAVNVWGKK